MKKTEFKTLKTKKPEDLRKLAKDKKNEILKILAKIASGQEKNLKKAKNLKKDLAQILTTIKEVEIIDKLQKVEEPKRITTNKGKDKK